MPSAPSIANNNLYANATNGSSNVVLYKTLFALANAAAMSGSYTGKRPVTATVEFIESLTGETSLTRQYRRDHSAIIAEESKLALMENNLEIETAESVFIAAAKRCPPSEYQVRGVMEVLAHFLNVTEPDARLVQPNGIPINGWQSRTALLELQKIIGPIHPLTQAAIHALREEVR